MAEPVILNEQQEEKSHEDADQLQKEEPTSTAVDAGDHEEEKKDIKTTEAKAEEKTQEKIEGKPAEEHRTEDIPAAAPPAAATGGNDLAQDAGQESLHDLVKETMQLAGGAKALTDPNPKLPRRLTSPPPMRLLPREVAETTRPPSSPDDHLTKTPSKLVRYRNKLIDEREFHEAVITPVLTNPELPNQENHCNLFSFPYSIHFNSLMFSSSSFLLLPCFSQPKNSIVLVQALQRGRIARKKFKKIRTHLFLLLLAFFFGLHSHAHFTASVKCSYIAKEIYTTEKAYVDSLCFVMEVRPFPSSSFPPARVFSTCSLQ